MLQIIFPLADVTAAIAGSVLTVAIRLVVFPESLVDVAIRVIISTFPVSLIVVPLSLVSITVLEDFFAPAFPLSILVDVAGENGLTVLWQAFLLDKDQTFVIRHPVKARLIFIIRFEVQLLAGVAWPQVHIRAIVHRPGLLAASDTVHVGGLAHARHQALTDVFAPAEDLALIFGAIGAATAVLTHYYFDY